MKAADIGIFTIFCQIQKSNLKAIHKYLRVFMDNCRHGMMYASTIMCMIMAEAIESYLVTAFLPHYERTGGDGTFFTDNKLYESD